MQFTVPSVKDQPHCSGTSIPSFVLQELIDPVQIIAVLEDPVDDVLIFRASVQGFIAFLCAFLFLADTEMIG